MGGKRRRSRPASPPGINREIDRLFHPHFHKGPLPIISDTLAHALVEQDPQKSIEKFVEYNLGPLVREILKVARDQGGTKRPNRNRPKQAKR